MLFALAKRTLMEAREAEARRKVTFLQSPAELVLRDFNFCVIDEVDSILIDEARTPLIISGMADKPSERYIQSAKISEALEKDYHYKVDEKQKSILFTEEGYEACEELLQVTDLYDPRTQWALYIINALKAKELQLKDVNYIVKGGEVVIVDEFTGRTMVGRRWSDGLHQAVEAKEALTIHNENGKWNAVRREIARMNKKGRPVLVGTTSVERSEEIGRLLDEDGIGYELLNAKPENVEREAEIVAQSGRKGAVTIATNMAGRGTDILLGGNAEFMARLRVRERLLPKIVKPEEGDIAFEKKSLGGANADKWKVKDGLYPCDLSPATEALLKSAVDTWGARSIGAFDAEDKLSNACDKTHAE